MRKSFNISGVALVLIAGGFGYAVWYSSDLQRAKRDVREHLVDPASAIFSSVEPCEEGGELRYVAGYVNSRNSMGGMTGNRRFLAQAVWPAAGLADTEISSFRLPQLLVRSR